MQAVSAVLLAILLLLAMPPRWSAPLRRRRALHAAARLVGHVVPLASVPFGLALIALDARFVPALLGFAGYLAGAVRAAHLRTPRLTAELSLLHPLLEARDALTVLRGEG